MAPVTILRVLAAGVSFFVTSIAAATRTLQAQNDMLIIVTRKTK
jgi:hypothetical protein